MEGAIFRSYLGDAWDRLHPDIQKRFYADPPDGKGLRYLGTMQHIDASFAGLVMGKLFHLFCSALCPWTGKDVPADISVYKKDGDPLAVYKKRIYFFPKKSYQFDSYMRRVGDREVLEYVTPWLGIRLYIEEQKGDLYFYSDECFIDIFGKRFFIPPWMGVGKIELWHRNVGPEAFTIEIVIRHLLFGQIFYQSGSFRHA